MNPPNPYFNPSSTYFPPNSNAYPNPNFSYSLPPNPQSLPPKPSSSLISVPPSNPDLLSTFSILKDVIDLANKTINSISNLLHSENHPKPNGDFCSCPFDSRHQMPPESLFHHSLCCPSSPRVIDLGILESLHYPNSLKSEDELRKENRFVQSLPESDADLCFSIDHYGDFESNFFYRDCPGVVCSSEQDSTKRTFTLPGVLSAQCANFICSSIRETRVFPKECFVILPSDLLALKSEIELWNDYPYSYSINVLRVFLCLQMVEESDSLKWIISNSPCYGILIDAHMRDHIFLLLKLCLKAISQEAYRSRNFLLSRDSNEGDGDLNSMSLRFKCPILFEVVTWLASQLSVLYGEANGKFFSVNMLKNCILNVASSLLLFPLEQKKTEASEGSNASKEGYGNLDLSDSNMGCEFVGSNMNGSGVVFVSQVAAAVAALHERSLLEEKIKGLRLVGSLSKSQLLSEHSYMTMRADEERKKRSNYRPILEHDGLLWQRSRNHDSNKVKTREELLAEERDYKRRRMSYRGKKVKRTTTEVMRDIIEEHMEEIKQAGGIGCFVKGSAEGSAFPPGSVYFSGMTTDDEFKGNECISSEPSKGEGHSYMKQLRFNNNNMVTEFEDTPLKDHPSMSSGLKNSTQRQRRESHGRHGPLEDHQRGVRKEKQDREYRPRSPESHRSHGSHDRHRYRRGRDEMEVSRNKYDKNGSISSHRSKDHYSRSFSSTSNPSSDLSEGRHGRMSESKDRHRGITYGNRRSESVTQNRFKDRYDPSESDRRYEENYDDVSSGSKYVRPDKVYRPNDVEHPDEMQSTDYTAKGCYHTSSS